MRALITGICGFAGSHLAEHLIREGDEVSGIALPNEPRTNLRGEAGSLPVVEADVADGPAMVKVLAEFRPEAVYHLAGVASVGQAWGSVAETLKTNALGLISLVEAGRAAGNPPILVVGSGEMYGRVAPERQPIGEETPLNPANPYALSKLWQEEAARYFADVTGYPLVICRSFNHTGPRQSRHFVCSDFAAQLAEIEAGSREPFLRVGNLEARRDFLDVRDVVRAYRLLVSRGRRGLAYNIASGEARSVREVLDILMSHCRARAEIIRDPERLRPVDLPLLSGDCARLRRETGWAPRIPLERTLGDLLDDWRGRITTGEGGR